MHKSMGHSWLCRCSVFYIIQKHKFSCNFWLQ